MNGKELERIKQTFQLVVLPHIEAIKDRLVKLEGQNTGMDTKLDAYNATINRHEKQISKNKTNVQNIKDGFKTSLTVAVIIIGIVTVVANIIIAMVM